MLIVIGCSIVGAVGIAAWALLYCAVYWSENIQKTGMPLWTWMVLEGLSTATNGAIGILLSLVKKNDEDQSM